MRVTGGALTGSVFRCPPGSIRPAMDRMRESVFAVLGSLEGKSFLDLFSGSGIVAIEALSRGASPVVLVEKDRLKRAALAENTAKALRERGEADGRSITCRFLSAELFLLRAKSAFDVIFCDPPFPYRFRGNLLDTIASRALLAPEGALLIHRPREAPLPPRAGPLSRTDSREYGRSVVDFYRRQGTC